MALLRKLVFRGACIAVGFVALYAVSTAAATGPKPPEMLPQSAEIAVDLVLNGAQQGSVRSAISVSAPRDSSLGTALARLSTAAPQSRTYGQDVLSALQAGGVFFAFAPTFLITQVTYPSLLISPSRVEVSATQPGLGLWTFDPTTASANFFFRMKLFRPV